LLNWIIGGIFAVTAIIFLIKILLHKDGMKKLEHTAPVSQTGNEK
jgi:hypothetical protein